MSRVQVAPYTMAMRCPNCTERIQGGDSMVTEDRAWVHAECAGDTRPTYPVRVDITFTYSAVIDGPHDFDATGDDLTPEMWADAIGGLEIADLDFTYKTAWDSA